MDNRECNIEILIQSPFMQYLTCISKIFNINEKHPYKITRHDIPTNSFKVIAKR
jgi:hypothetical protein